MRVEEAALLTCAHESACTVFAMALGTGASAPPSYDYTKKLESSAYLVIFK